VIHNHGGEILCRSVPHGGTTFTVLLPLATDGRLAATDALDHVNAG
jgi:signal transduction histidine kinase